MGPGVRWNAYGVWWSGIPSNYDWAGNEAPFELVFWLSVFSRNRGEHPDRLSIFVVGIVHVLTSRTVV